MARHALVTGVALIAAGFITARPGVAVSAKEQAPSARVNVRVVASPNSVLDVASYVRERLTTAGIDVTDRCEQCDAILSVKYREQRGASFLNGLVATEIDAMLVLADALGRNLWSEQIQVRSPGLVTQDGTQEHLREYAARSFRDNLFSYYLGEWVLAKLGWIAELTVLQRAVSNTSIYTGASYTAAKQAVPILQKLGPTATLALITALTHPNWDIRADAATALGDVGDATAVVPLERLVRDDKDDLVRKAGGDALSKLRSRRR